MITNIKTFQKYIILILFLWANISAFSQKVQTGIYEVIYDVDTAFVHQNTIKVNVQDRNNNIKYVYNYNYTNYIEKAHEIKYAVIIKNEYPDDKSYYNLDMVWLNKKIDNNFNKSYSDGISRKYIEYKIAIKNKNQSERFYNENDLIDNIFLKYYKTAEYPDFRGDETGNYEENTLGINKDYFFIKSNIYKPIVNSVKVDSSSYYSHPFYGSGFKKQTQYVTINQAAVAFKPKVLKSYKKFLSIQTDSLQFYCDDKSNKFLNQGDFIAVTQEADEWYIGDHISTDGEVISGKIFIDDLTDGETKSITQNGLILKAKYSLFDETQGWNQSGVISGIKIYDKDRLVQVIKNAGFVSDTTTVLDFDDVNFDGYKDLVVFSHDGGAGPNFGNNYYIFNSKNKQFVYNETMSNLTQPEVNAKTKTVYAAWRNGASNHGAETYKWIKNKLTMVEYYETNYTSEDKLIETHTFLLDGKMRTKSQIKRYKKSRNRKVI